MANQDDSVVENGTPDEEEGKRKRKREKREGKKQMTTPKTSVSLPRPLKGHKDLQDSASYTKASDQERKRGGGKVPEGRDSREDTKGLSGGRQAG